MTWQHSRRKKNLGYLQQIFSRNTDIKDFWRRIRRIKENYREILHYLRESLTTTKKLSRNLDLEDLVGETYIKVRNMF